MQKAFDVIQELGLVDVIVFQEICDRSLFERLADTSGYNFYLSPGSDNVQKLGVFYSKDLELVFKPSQILEEHKHTFAQRLPIKITFRHGTLGEVSVIGLHLKANIPRADFDAREDSYQRRKQSAVILQEYIKNELSAEKVVIVGDWNDDVDISNHENKETPFKSLIDDDLSFRFVTYYLSYAMIESSKYGSVIDHICISNELFSSYRSSSVVGVKEQVQNYIKDCSDHFPVYVVFETE